MINLKIKEIRKKKKISLYKLSQSTKIAKSYLKDLEDNKKTNPSLLVMYKIALTLDVNIEDLFSVDIEKLRKTLHESINNTGLNSKKTLATSGLLDLLINKEMNKRS